MSEVPIETAEEMSIFVYNERLAVAKLICLKNHFHVQNEEVHTLKAPPVRVIKPSEI